ncbi:PREDICTED: probable disease resistance protein At4g27220 isoform X2 [Lupinus angustifolius]|uniref:probable disease resistance protein At4g27220 isoform X2 n=1 Tax=Lupinus angustifolius TaxID=3871 RepID=UPI00092F5ADD|nr:PREDICTED: probable disease resistance protein At4g27220 isoform X2 [Lupinus angustifolius]
MADIAKSIGKYIAEKLGRELGYVISYESNFDSLIAEVKRLEEAKDVIYHSVEAANRNGEVIEIMATNWLEKVDAIVIEAEEFQKNEGHAKAECSCGHLPNLWARHQLSMKAKDIAKDIPGVIKDGEKITKVSYPPPLLVGITSSYARGYEALDSRTSILNHIMQTLMDPHVFKVGLWGMGGVGKSTLVKELAWKAVKDCSFGTVVSVELTEYPDVKTIQVKIAETLGMKKFDVETLDVRASRLRQRICKEESILIIMDNIWERLDLIEVGVPFGDDHKGCKLLFTSRNLNILTQEMSVEEQCCFKLEVLSEKESWSLFEKQVGDALKDNNIRPTALKVAKACCDLPLLLITVANALKNKRLPAWNDALQQLTRFNHKGLAATVYSAIELSYNHLAHDELKLLFLLLGSMGQTTFWIQYVLVAFWSLGLFEDVDSLAHARNRLYCLVTELKSACLLLEKGKDTESFKMHDVVQGVARKLASRDRPIFAVKQYSELKKWPEIYKKCYRMFLPECRIHDLPKSLECPELEILELGSQNNFLKVPDSFLEETKELKCLYLSGLDCIPSIASSLCRLPNLCALHLCECMLEDVAILAELKNLEILDFSDSEIRELPPAIGNLTRLRLLGLSNVSGLRAIPAKIISRLTRLEELCMENTFIQWEDEERKGKNACLGELSHLHQLTFLEVMIHDASVLPKGLFIFGQLEKYRIFIGDDCKWSSGNGTISKTLKLNQGKTKNIHLHIGIKLLLSNVEELCLTNLHGVISFLYQLNEEGFPQLKHLDVQSSDDIQYIIDLKEWHHSRETFPKLESLILHNLPNMRKICSGPLLVRSFGMLKVIKVKSCDQLDNVFSYSLVKDLSSLLEVEISKCKIMSKIITDEDAEIDKIEFPQLHSITLDYLPNLASFCSKPMPTDMKLRSMIEYVDDSTILRPLFDEKISFPNLDNLKISSINLRMIWGDKLSEHSYIQKLKSLMIYGCYNLRFLFPSSVARGLVNLQHLSISGCGMLEEIFSTEEKIVNLPSDTISLSNDEVVFPSLETLVVSNMDNLKTIWNNAMASNSFPKLTKLEITFCNKLMNIVSSYVLKHLETMIVTSCDSLEVVFDMERLNSCSVKQHGLPTQLRTLTLKDLPKLKHIWSKDPCGVLGFQNLCTVEVSDCQGLNHVFPLSVGMELKNLQALKISSCGIEHIVARDEMPELAPKFVLPKLKSLKFWILPKLRSFCHGIQTLECPNLKELDVFDCDEMEIDDQPLFSFEKVIQSVEDLSLSSKGIRFICCNNQQSDFDFFKVKALCLQRLGRHVEFPIKFFQRFTNLEELTLFSCSFQSIPHIEHEVISKWKTLTLHSLWYLENICQENSQMEQILQNLQTLHVVRCWTLLTIAPSHVRFQNLNTLLVNRCDALVNIISSKAARGMPTLQKLVIFNCKMIKEIVFSEDDDANEIAFMKLEFLQLECLPSLTSFCNGNLLFKFPLLKTLFVMECPMMETFSQGIIRAPLLKEVSLTSEGDEFRWNGDLNTTIEFFFTEQHSKEV